jgi:hypothetical protein
MKTIFTMVGVIGLVVLVVALGPLLTLWAFNQLFPGVLAQDPYTFYNWFAVIVLGAFFRANVSIKKS